MSCLLPEPGHVFVSCDLSAGEPSVTAHFSQDKSYYDACFGMVGKAPCYRDGVLRIDDIYLMTASVSPLARDAMAEAFNRDWGGKTFAQQWLEDPEVIKSALKETRALHKILCLGLGYSMGPRKLRSSAYEKGYDIPAKTAKAFFNAYWELFNGVRRLADGLEAKFKREGYLVNPFGYKLHPEPSYKAFNYFIQSSVSGVMNVLYDKFTHYAPYTEYVTTIHDEHIISVPEARLDEAKAAMQEAEKSLNHDLNWSVKIRVGWKPGKDLYGAK